MTNERVHIAMYTDESKIKHKKKLKYTGMQKGQSWGEARDVETETGSERAIK